VNVIAVCDCITQRTLQH